VYSLAICAFRVNTLKHTEYTEYTEKAPNKLAIGIKASVYSLCDLCIPSEYFKAHPDNYRGTEYTEKAQNNLSNTSMFQQMDSPLDSCWTNAMQRIIIDTCRLTFTHPGILITVAKVDVVAPTVVNPKL